MKFIQKLVLIVVLLAGLLFVGKKLIDESKDAANNLMPHTEMTLDSTDVIIDSLKQIQQFQFNKIDIYTSVQYDKDRYLLVNIPILDELKKDDHIVRTYHGVFQYGVDMRKVKDWISYKDSIVFVHLPKVTILNSKHFIQEDKTKIKESANDHSKDDPEIRKEMVAKAKAKLLKVAKNEKYFKQAENSGRVMFTKLLKTKKVKDVRIYFDYNQNQ